MKLLELAHCRSGDKGNVSNLCVFAYDPENYARLRESLTAERVKAHLQHLVAGPVLRYELPQLAALNFVMHGALDGGVTRSLGLDPHGKCLSFALMNLNIEAETAGPCP
jgi:hypothetical protein